MTCQEAVFATATCWIEISDQTVDRDMPLFVARMSVIDRDRSSRHLLESAEGRPIELHGSTDAMALNAAISFLARRYGGLTEYPHGCGGFEMLPASTPALVIETAG
jgi:hypothetical protein